MRANKGKHTKPEMTVRGLLHAMGYRFRIHMREIPGTPDIAFPARRKVILVHGCFWHQHQGCKDGRTPRVRRDYWIPKLEKNKLRDARIVRVLAEAGWRARIVWECELRNEKNLAGRLSRFLGAARSR